jgi:hypothetical protein
MWSSYLCPTDVAILQALDWIDKMPFGCSYELEDAAIGDIPTLDDPVLELSIYEKREQYSKLKFPTKSESQRWLRKQGEQNGKTGRQKNLEKSGWQKNLDKMLMWSHGLVPQIECPHVVQAAEWNICWPSVAKAIRSRTCIVYSFGVADSDPFTEFMATTSCQIFAFDPGVDHPLHYANNTLFYHWGLTTGAKTLSQEKTFAGAFIAFCF